MGLFKDYVSQTRKPQGRLGKMMKCYTPEQISEALRAAGFSKVTTDHHPNKPWITVIAKK